MDNHKHKILIIASHPVQYSSPLYRLMAKHSKLDIQVAYCSMKSSQSNFDTGFGTKVVWDIPLLDGYPWIEVKNDSPNPGIGNFWGLMNLLLWSTIRKGNFDAVIVYTGYTYFSFWVAMLATKSTRSKFLFSTDASEIEPRSRRKWKTFLKNLVLPFIFRLADVVIVSSTLGQKVVQSLGISEQNIAMTPFVVDNDRWKLEASQVNISTVRQQWGIPEDANVLLFCAKLQEWKKPQDVLRAFAQANIINSYLLFAGEGPLRNELEATAISLSLVDRVKFLGFINQSQLPSIYSAANLFILPSDYEPFGVVVNEAMLCGCPVIVSDRVGSRYDLIKEGENGFIYPCGDIESLAKILQVVLPDRELLRKMGMAATKSMESWSPAISIELLVRALEKSIPKI
jgi:glycosyltransferase involved in cell wall biosynthesis